MIVIPAGAKVHLALGHTEMRKGLDGIMPFSQQTVVTRRSFLRTAVPL
jgi:transposase